MATIGTPERDQQESVGEVHGGLKVAIRYYAGTDSWGEWDEGAVEIDLHDPFGSAQKGTGTPKKVELEKAILELEPDEAEALGHLLIKASHMLHDQKIGSELEAKELELRIADYERDS
jgi:hypothetical protein